MFPGFLSETRNILYISFLKNYKTAKQCKLRPPVEWNQFSDKNLCVCHHLDVYLERTKAWWKNEGQLLLSLITPHKFVTTQTVSCCIVEVLSLSGIGTSVFKAHSTRSISSSKARLLGTSTEEILKKGHWSKESTFQKFYFRNIEK